MTETIRCGWCDLNSPLYVDYHDMEWGVVQTNDEKLFEMLILEGMQAGLSWLTILKKRAAFREAFNNFVPEKVARFTDEDVVRLLTNEKIVRNRLKLGSAIQNARVFCHMQQEEGSFARYLWKYVDFSPVQNSFSDLSELPAQTPLSQKISKDLKKRGMNFVGPTIIYALMQAIGMVNDHLTGCFRYQQCREYGESFNWEELV